MTQFHGFPESKLLIFMEHIQKKKKFREIYLFDFTFDFTSFFGLDFLTRSL